MKSSDDPQKKALAARPGKKASFEVGYGKPPATTRFKPGQSGNPKGRPKGSKNKTKVPALYEEKMKAILLEEAYRTIKVKEGSGQVTVTMAQAVIRSLAVNAAKGNLRAQRLFTELLFTTERENKRLHDEWLDTAITYKVEWERELARRERLGITGPEPLPHPDHVIINVRTNEVRITGPATKEEKEQWDIWHQHHALFKEELEVLKSLIGDHKYEDQEGLLVEIGKTEQVLKIIDQLFEIGHIPPNFPKLEPLKKG